MDTTGFAPDIGEHSRSSAFGELVYYQGDELLSLLLYIRRARHLNVDPELLQRVLESKIREPKQGTPVHDADQGLQDVDWLVWWERVWRANLAALRSLHSDGPFVVPDFAPGPLYGSSEYESPDFFHWRASVQFGNQFGSRGAKFDEPIRSLSAAGVRWIYVVPVEGDWSAHIDRDIFAISCDAFLDDARSLAIIEGRFAT